MSHRRGRCHLEEEMILEGDGMKIHITARIKLKQVKAMSH